MKLKKEDNIIAKSMKYKKIKPCKHLEPFIHFYWELKGNENEEQWERVFPDGCAGILMWAINALRITEHFQWNLVKRMS